MQFMFACLATSELLTSWKTFNFSVVFFAGHSRRSDNNSLATKVLYACVDVHHHGGVNFNINTFGGTQGNEEARLFELSAQ